MPRALNLPTLSAELSALPHAELVELFAAAHAARNRDEFLRLAQRIAHDAVRGLNSGRLAPHSDDLYSEALLAWIRAFDSTTRPTARPYSYFRTAARRGAITWAKSQHLIRRKGAKHVDVRLDADVSPRDFDGPTVVENAVAATADDSRPWETAALKTADDSTDLRILSGLQSGASRAKIAAELGAPKREVDKRISAMQKRAPERNKFSSGLCLALSIARALDTTLEDVVDIDWQAHSPRALHAMGYSYVAIAKRLNTSFGRVYRACNPTYAKV